MKNGLLVIAVAALATIGCAREEKYTDVVRDVQNKTAMITVDTTVDQVPARLLGSAVFITPTGGLLTCAHVVDVPAGSTITVTTSDGKLFPATVLNIDVAHDLALLKVGGFHEFAALAGGRLQLGQEVIAVGNPYGMAFTTSHGIISHLDRDLNLGYFFTQIDAPINPGNSGGPLFDLDGDLIGINARGVHEADGLAFSIAPSVIRAFLAQFRGL